MAATVLLLLAWQASGMQARTCEPSDRVRIAAAQPGQEFLVAGRPGIPDAALRYFVSQ